MKRKVSSNAGSEYFFIRYFLTSGICRKSYFFVIKYEYWLRQGNTLEYYLCITWGPLY